MTKSESIAKLAEAMSKAQGSIRNAVKDSDNPYFKSKYADLASVVDACRGELAANGLAVVQLPTMRKGKLVLEYILMHSSGEFIASELEMQPVKSDPQGIGSAITYARRYTLSSVTGVATEDDDGNAASNGSDKSAAKPKQAPVSFRKPQESAAPNNGQGGKPQEGIQPPLAAETESADANTGDDYITSEDAAAIYMYCKKFKPKEMKESVLRSLIHDWCKVRGLVDVKGDGTLLKVRKTYMVEGNPVSGVVRTREALEHHLLDLLAAGTQSK